MRIVLLLFVWSLTLSAATVVTTTTTTCRVMTEPWGNIPTGETCDVFGTAGEATATVEALSVRIDGYFTPAGDPTDINFYKQLIEFRYTVHAEITLTVIGGTGPGFLRGTVFSCGNRTSPRPFGWLGAEVSTPDGRPVFGNCSDPSFFYVSFVFGEPLTYRLDAEYYGSQHGWGTADSSYRYIFDGVRDANFNWVPTARLIDLDDLPPSEVPEPSTSCAVTLAGLAYLYHRRAIQPVSALRQD